MIYRIFCKQLLSLLTLAVCFVTSCTSHQKLGVEAEPEIQDRHREGNTGSSKTRCRFKSGELTELTQGDGIPVLLDRTATDNCPDINCIKELFGREEYKSLCETYPHWYRVVSKLHFKVFRNLKSIPWGVHGTRDVAGIVADRKLCASKSTAYDAYTQVVFCASLKYCEKAIAYGTSGVVICKAHNILKNDSKYSWEMMSECPIPFYIMSKTPL